MGNGGPTPGPPPVPTAAPGHPAPSQGGSSRSHSLFGTGSAGLSLRSRRARLPAGGAMQAARRSPRPRAGRVRCPPPPRGCRRGPGDFKGAGGSSPATPAPGGLRTGGPRGIPPTVAVPAADQGRRRVLSHGATPSASPRAGPRTAAGQEASGSGRGPRPALPLMHCGRRRAPAPAAEGPSGPQLGDTAGQLDGGARRRGRSVLQHVGGAAGPARGRRARWGKQQKQQHPGIRSLPAAPGGGGEGGRETERARRWRGQMTTVTRQRDRPRPSTGAER